jgi:serine/threonine protein kinase
MIGQLLTGRYLILKKLGAGGFSETYLARDKYLPRHPVCVVKCFNVSPNSTISLETAQRLFETEARILDQLGRQHAQIPTLYAYCHEHEQIYQVQEYIDGENLRDWVNQGRRLIGEAAIDLLQSVLPVLEYIHSHRVIHRDIKPSNLIRRRRDGKVVLIDFGAACFLSDSDAQTKPESDDTPIAIGTPGYMPDEQHLGMSQMNSDLYALGILTIQLLTGVQPHQFQQDLISGELNWQRHLRKGSGSSTIPAELIAILERMVRSHPHNRYQSATDVLSDLQALPLDRPHRRSARQWVVPNWQRSVQQAWKPIAVTLLLSGLLGAGYLYSGGHGSVAALSKLALLTRSSTVDLTILHDWSVDFEVDRLLVAPDNQTIIAAGSDYVLHLWSLSNGAIQRSLSGHTGKINALSVSQDGRLLVSGSDDRTLRVWDVASGQLLQTLEAHQTAVTAVALSADANTLASGDQNGTIRLWDVASGALLKTVVASDAAITALVYGAVPNSLISASGNRLSVWDLLAGNVHRQFAGHTGTILGLQRVDHMLISVGDDRTLVWNLEREELMQVCSEDSAKTVTASLSDRHMITVNDNGSIRVWGARAGHLVEAGSGELGQNLDVALSPDHRYLVSWRPDHRLQVWQMSAALP